MGAHRTAWHFYFTILLRRRAPSWIEVRDEVPLSEERPRMDYLFLRKHLEAPSRDAGLTLRDLWPRLPRLTIAELKSIGRPYETGDLDRLWGYTHLYFAGTRDIAKRGHLAALLIVPNRTPSLDADIAEMSLDWIDLGGGYWQVSGGLFQLYVAELDTIAASDDDDVLRLFSHDRTRTTEGRRFWAGLVGTKEAMMQAHDLEGYDEVVQRFLEQLSPEQRLAGLAPEQVVGAFTPEQMLLALPDSVLRGFSDEYVASLPTATREAIRKRIGR